MLVTKIIEFCLNRSRLVILASVVMGVIGWISMKKLPMDAIPDLSETQVILFTEWMGRNPQLIEDQVTYPLVTRMLSVPGVSTVRGFSMFGMSFVYVIFNDSTDIYWARSRILEYLPSVMKILPENVTPILGPDATGVGWIYQYVLKDDSGKHSLAEMRAFQDWYLKYWLSSVAGVAEVASIGGFEKQYQVELNPGKMYTLKISPGQIAGAIRMSNQAVGGSTLQRNEREYYVNSPGYVYKKEDLENVAISLGQGGTPLRLAELARIIEGPGIRRGVTDFNGEGDHVGGVIVMRQGEDAVKVIANVKKKIAEISGSLPEGIEIVPVYDRSGLIRDAVRTLSSNLIEEIIVVCIVIFVFLLHFRSVLIVAITLPLTVLISFIPMYFLDIRLNIMSLGGIILAAGDIVDGIVVCIENAHKRFADTGESDVDRKAVILEACREVGPSIFSSLLVIAISFIPIFALQAQEGKLFHPMAYTKTFAMLVAAVITITLTPALMYYLIRGRIFSEEKNPVNRFIDRYYTPVLRYALEHKRNVIIATVILTVVPGFLFTRLGSEFMPPLWEGDLLYMPITNPGISVDTARQLITAQNVEIKKIPEVESVFGKAGRYETPTDPAPLSMFEATIRLKPRSEWRKGMNDEKLLTELDQAVKIGGLNRAWTKPVRGRVDMLSTGIRTQVGVKIFGKDLVEIEKIGKHIEMQLSQVKGTRSVYAEKISEGYYVDFIPDRLRLQRYGINVGDAQMVLETVVGGMVIGQTVQGRERYAITLRYPRELRDSTEQLRKVLVTAAGGAQIPLGELGDIQMRNGPPMILDENGFLAGYVYVDLTDRDTGGYVEDAKKKVAEGLKLPAGYFLKWTGQYEYLERMQARMKYVIPLTLILVFIVLYIGNRSVLQSSMIMVSVPLCLSGAILLMFALNYNTSVAVYSGAIALIGVAVETTAIMLVFVDDYIKKAGTATHDAILAGARKSLRPVMMATGMNILGLVPIMIDSGVGSDVMKRIAIPMAGGLATLIILTLIFVPVYYSMLKKSETLPPILPPSRKGKRAAA